MSSSTLLSVFALFLICCVHQTEAQRGTVCVVLSTGNTNEDAGPVVFNLIRKLGTEGNCTVFYELTDESTQPDDTLGDKNGNVTFLDGQTMATVEVQINDDNEPEDAEQFRIILSGDCIGAVTSTSAIIADNDFSSPWGPWVGDCSVTCGPANKTETRNRTCNAVRPSNCMQTLTDSRIVDCNLPGCPIITPWSEWTNNGTCSTTCGPGTQMQFRNRTCTANCLTGFISVETRTVECEICLCPTISMWSEWTDVGSCSTTCGQGTQMQSRDRTCTNSNCCPANFESSQTRNITCEICPCPVIGLWCPWGNTGSCSVTCGCGTQMQARHRVCVNTCTPPDCIKREERTVTCTQAPCHTAWTTWNRWSGASTWNRWSGPSTWNRWSGPSTRNRWSRGSTRNRWSGGSTRNRWSGSTRNRRRGSWQRRFYWG